MEEVKGKKVKSYLLSKDRSRSVALNGRSVDSS